MNNYTFRYRQERHVNQWGTERITAHFVDGVRYTQVDNVININVNKQIKLKFHLRSSVDVEHGNLSRNIGTEKFYVSDEYVLNIKTRKTLEELLIYKSTIQYPEYA